MKNIGDIVHYVHSCSGPASMRCHAAVVLDILPDGAAFTKKVVPTLVLRVLVGDGRSDMEVRAAWASAAAQELGTWHEKGHDR